MSKMLILVFIVISNSAIAQNITECNWTGTWSSSFGDLRLIQTDQSIKGDYASIGMINGNVDQNCLFKGEFQDTRQGREGTFVFILEADRFKGLWGWEDNTPDNNWGGTRKSADTPQLINEELYENACDWSGVWSSTLRDLTLNQNGNAVSGTQGSSGIISANTVGSCKAGSTTRLRGTIEDKVAKTKQQFDITKSGRSFSGTWAFIGGQGVPKNNFWGGTLRELNKSIGVANETENVVEGEAVAEQVQPETKNNPSVGIWRVSLDSICVIGKEEGETGLLKTAGLQIYGIAWVKARIFDKKVGREIMLAPKSGFPNLTGDKERVWERRADQYLSVGGICDSFSSAGIQLNYEINAQTYGYSDIAELISNSKNRIRVMVKLGEYDSDSPNDELGTKAKSSSLISANFCGSCQKEKSDQRFGDGVLSGFRDGGDEVIVLYDIKRLQ